MVSQNLLFFAIVNVNDQANPSHGVSSPQYQTLKNPHCVFHLVPSLDEIVSQLLDSHCGVSGYRVLSVMCHQNGLSGLDDDDAFSALFT